MDGPTMMLVPQQVVEATLPDSQTRRKTKIHCKQELIVMSLQAFYTGRKDLPEVLELLNGTSIISLRLIDWFVTNYAKRHNIGYMLEGSEFMVYLSYKSQLKAYSKKLFDPFCRRERIMFSLPGVAPFVTTVGKLNFFRWAIEKGVLDYIKMNMAKIETAMNASSKEVQKLRKAISNTSTTSVKSATRKRVVQTQQPNSKLMQKHEYTVEVTFN